MIFLQTATSLGSKRSSNDKYRLNAVTLKAESLISPPKTCFFNSDIRSDNLSCLPFSASAAERSRLKNVVSKIPEPHAPSKTTSSNIPGESSSA